MDWGQRHQNVHVLRLISNTQVCQSEYSGLPESMVKKAWYLHPRICIQNLALPLPSCVTTGKLLLSAF